MLIAMKMGTKVRYHTTRIAASAWPAPEIIAGTKSLWPGESISVMCRLVVDISLYIGAMKGTSVKYTVNHLYKCAYSYRSARSIVTP